MELQLQSVSAENRFDRAAWLALLGVLSIAALVVVVTFAILALPSDGWQVPGSNEVSQLVHFYGDWPTPLRQGDIVLAVNGLNVNSQDGAWLTRYNLPGWQVGASVTYRVRRDGQVIDVPVELRQADPASQWRAVANAMRDTPGEWSWPLIALAVFWLRPGSRAARLLLALMVSHAAAVKLGWAATIVASNFAPPWLFYPNLFILNFWIWLFWPSVIWLVLSFPLPMFPLTRWPRLVPAVLYGFGGAGLALSALTRDLLPVTVALVGELLVLLLALVLAVVNAVRRGGAVERAQVSWVILGVTVSLGLNLAVYLLDYFHPFLSQVPAWFSYPVPLVLPLCLAIAITRYRLFEIEVIIRRTLVYALLTGLLLLAYFGSVVVLQNTFGALVGQRQSPLVTVLSTLVIAALFVPLRRGVQSVIDRRFYRQKYDAARALAEYSARLRDDAAADLDSVSEHLIAVVDQTMKPQSVWILLRAPASRDEGAGQRS